MTTAIFVSTSSWPNWLRSTLAVLAGVLPVVAISLATDQILHVLKVYPPWRDPMYQPGLNALALSYRMVYGVLGGYLTARFSPQNPMRHALILGALGFIVSMAGLFATLPMHIGPAWYPIALAVTAVPCAWLGGRLVTRGPASYHLSKFD